MSWWSARWESEEPVCTRKIECARAKTCGCRGSTWHGLLAPRRDAWRASLRTSLHARRIRRRDAAVERSRCGDVAPCAHDPSTSRSVIAAAAGTQSLAPKWWRADRCPLSAVKARKSSRCSIRVEQASSGWQSGDDCSKGSVDCGIPAPLEHLTAQAGTLAHASHAKPMRRRTASSSRRCVAEEALTSPRRPFGRHPHLSHSSSHQRDAAGRGESTK